MTSIPAVSAQQQMLAETSAAKAGLPQREASLAEKLLTGTVTGMVSALSEGRVSATALTQAALQRIDDHDGLYNSFTEVTTVRALAEAADIDRRRAGGETLPPLAGVPYAVKNLFDVAGLVTLAGSRINRDLPPASEDALLVRAMQAQGAVLLGALNMDEYAYGFTTENSHYGPARNPHDPSRSAGGSSGGCGTAVAAGMVPLTLGSDTNGSVRVPSSMCGIFGLKPTYGALSLQGMFPFVHSLDHAGIFARSSHDLALSYALLHRASHDQTRSRVDSGTLSTDISRLRIAMAGGHFTQGNPEANAAVQRIATALGTQQMVELPQAARARSAAYLITASEGAQQHLQRLRTRAADFDPMTRPRLLAGSMMPAAWYIGAQRFRRWFQSEVAKLFQDVDIILAPSTPCSAQKIGQDSMTINGVEMPTRPNIGMFTQPISFIGLPVVSVPVQQAGGMPIGVQIIAPPWREDMALRVAAYLESSAVVAAPVVTRVEAAC
ncbi:AtzE family amidohydrolase [Methylobacillus flagellatus]|uniref:AtzE family amidohydrolase n=1 Tax=Methylobacillus flagellatus TaxID=405 RepID=UPI001BB20F1E|nr:AtzE family amidohydrolase [Methylobacillus flagellatus]